MFLWRTVISTFFCLTVELQKMLSNISGLKVVKVGKVLQVATIEPLKISAVTIFFILSVYIWKIQV